MNILYIAYSCNPYAGSEDKIGWCVPFESAKTNNVYVITKEEQREPIERYLSENSLKNMKFFYVDIPDFYKKIYKGFLYSGRLNIWNKCALPIAKKLCREENIEIIHQITPVEFRAIGNYGQIDNVKFVCGPLGGGEFLPRGLRDYSKGHELVEIARFGANHWHRIRLKLTGKINNCDYLMFANKETQEFIGGTDVKVPQELILETGLRADELLNVSNYKKGVFLSAGRMIYRKGYDFLLDALMRIPKSLKYQVRIVGDGPELERLRKRCEEDDNLAEHVVFTGPISYLEMEKEYCSASTFIMPSIRETTGTVLLEAMSKGLPVITINRFGGATVFDDKTGWLYDGENKETYIENLKNTIIECVLNPNEVINRGQNAKKKANSYTWQEKNSRYQMIYTNLLNN